MSSHWMFHVAAMASLIVIAPAFAHSAEPVAVGATAPAFTLKDQAGRDTVLVDLVKKKPVALIFYRSADW